jgi:hypothetical protein
MSQQNVPNMLALEEPQLGSRSRPRGRKEFGRFGLFHGCPRSGASS